jgi:dihydrofolate reductase
MKTIVTTHWVTLDGFVSGPGDSMDWIRADEDLMNYEMALVKSADTLLLGRGTYEDFAGYWPAVARDSAADPSQRSYAQRLDQMQKVVVSRSLTKPAWPESKVMRQLSTTGVGELTSGDGTIVVYGSVQVVRELARLRLIDEIHLLVHPLAVGSGTPLFDTRVELELRRSQAFASGVMMSVYGLA